MEFERPQACHNFTVNYRSFTAYLQQKHRTFVVKYHTTVKYRILPKNPVILSSMVTTVISHRSDPPEYNLCKIENVIIRSQLGLDFVE